MHAQIDRLTDEIEELREHVDLLLARSVTPPPPTSSPRGDWQAMDATQASHAWTALVNWVDMLVDRYALDETVPVCWYAHGAMLEEMHALHRAWLGAYADRGAKASEPAFWHEILYRTLARLREWDRHGCVSGTHSPDAPVGPSEADCTERARHVHADLQARAARDGAMPTALG